MDRDSVAADWPAGGVGGTVGNPKKYPASNAARGSRWQRQVKSDLSGYLPLGGGFWGGVVVGGRSLGFRPCVVFAATLLAWAVGGLFVA